MDLSIVYVILDSMEMELFVKTMMNALYKPIIVHLLQHVPILLEDSTVVAILAFLEMDKLVLTLMSVRLELILAIPMLHAQTV